MNTMNMPGFTAKASLHKTNRTSERQYSASNDISEADGQVIVPQLRSLGGDPHQCYLDCIDSGAGDKRACFERCYGPA